jgi:hypothetical protein
MRAGRGCRNSAGRPAPAAAWRRRVDSVHFHFHRQAESQISRTPPFATSTAVEWTRGSGVRVEPHMHSSTSAPQERRWKSRRRASSYASPCSTEAFLDFHFSHALLDAQRHGQRDEPSRSDSTQRPPRLLLDPDWGGFQKHLGEPAPRVQLPAQNRPRVRPVWSEAGHVPVECKPGQAKSLASRLASDRELQLVRAKVLLNHSLSL